SVVPPVSTNGGGAHPARLHTEPRRPACLHPKILPPRLHPKIQRPTPPARPAGALQQPVARSRPATARALQRPAPPSYSASTMISGDRRASTPSFAAQRRCVADRLLPLFLELPPSPLSPV
uniref:Uncharacterized protein n=1 Tax=Aegilops tauschii subsp. strangulata TaxID=200361 RepID=A0A453DE16_AEGTS